MALFSKRQPAGDPARENLKAELTRVQRDLEDARRRFNQATESELIEQTVFELNALQARYTYFLRLAREHEDAASAARS